MNDQAASTDVTPKTAGIAPAQTGPLSVLQFTDIPAHHEPSEDDCNYVEAAAGEIARYHSATDNQATRYLTLASALQEFLTAIVLNCPAGPQRSTAISRACEAKFWASHAIALEPPAGQ